MLHFSLQSIAHRIVCFQHSHQQSIISLINFLLRFFGMEGGHTKAASHMEYRMNEKLKCRTLRLIVTEI